MDRAGGGPWAEWAGRSRTVTDRISLSQARRMAATLDRDASALGDGTVLPPGWHWIYFNEAVPRSGLAPDGHERRGDFLPPVPLERRMWAGGRIRFHGPLRIGEEAERTSTIERVTRKEGRSGPLVFVTVSHRIRGREGLVLEEEQDLVYRDPPPVPGPAAPAGPVAPAVALPPEHARHLGAFHADAATLFRFSALTFNGHRIHYDHPYATGEEGYPGLVVHGPLIALLLLDAGVRALGANGGGSRLERYGYRALAPLFCEERFDLVASEETASSPKSEEWTGPGAGSRSLRLWAVHPRRGVAMEATIRAGGPRASPP